MRSRGKKKLVFASEEALQVALTSGLVPAELQETPARVAPGKEPGSLELAPDAPLAEPVVRSLERAGVELLPGHPGADARAVRCWAEAVAVRRASDPEPQPGLALFVFPDGASTVTLCGEMLRLGCDRQRCCFDSPSGEGGAHPVSLVSAIDPPYYTLACAIERADGPRAFAPTAIGQERVWIELGYLHPLADRLRAPEGRLLLLPGRGPWITVHDGPWVDLYSIIDLKLPAEPLGRAAEPLPRRLSVTLRLGRAVRGVQPTLWVLREGALDQVDQLVQTLPEEVIGRLPVGQMNAIPEMRR